MTLFYFQGHRRIEIYVNFFLITTKLAKTHFKDDSKSLLYVCDLYLIFNIKIQLTDVKCSIKMRYFFNKLMDIHQTCMDISL